MPCCQTTAFLIELPPDGHTELTCPCCLRTEIRFWSEASAAGYARAAQLTNLGNVVVTNPGRACPHRKESGDALAPLG